jgi:hypothetical protein
VRDAPFTGILVPGVESEPDRAHAVAALAANSSVVAPFGAVAGKESATKPTGFEELMPEDCGDAGLTAAGGEVVLDEHVAVTGVSERGVVELADAEAFALLEAVLGREVLALGLDDGHR